MTILMVTKAKRALILKYLDIFYDLMPPKYYKLLFKYCNLGDYNNSEFNTLYIARKLEVDEHKVELMLQKGYQFFIDYLRYMKIK